MIERSRYKLYTAINDYNTNARQNSNNSYANICKKILSQIYFIQHLFFQHTITMNTNFRQSYHQASKWAHQHVLVVWIGLFTCAAMALTQLFVYPEKVEASRTPTRCSDNSWSLQITESECDVLSELYTATNGDTRYNNNWRFQGDGSSICRWWRYGIGNCIRDSQEEKYSIVEISFPYNYDGNNLAGILPSSLFTLPNLESIYMANNWYLDVNIDHITGSPYASNYRFINIANSTLHGDITNFNNLTNLEYLDVSCYTNYANGSEDMQENCTAIGDISFVPLLSNMYALRVWWHTNITFDLSYLETATQLREIYALDNYIVGDLWVLSWATGMESLDIACRHLIDGGCNVTGNLSALQNMNNLRYLSLDMLYNIEWTLDVLYDKINLTDVDLTDNKISWTIGAGIGNLTALTNLDLDGNLLQWTLPVEMYNLTMLQDLNLHGNQLSWPLLHFWLFRHLEWLNFGGNDFDYSNVRDMILPEEAICPMAEGGCKPNNSSLKRLRIDNANIWWQIADIRDRFPRLEELGLQFSKLTWPLPASFENLTNLKELQLRFNTLDGAIPTYLTTFNLHEWKLALESNCFDTDVTDENLLSLLDSSPGRENQFNCKANVRVTTQVNANALQAGQCTTYTIQYSNLWPQKAVNLKIGQTFANGITASGASIPIMYEEGLVWRTYWTLDDPCYVQATQQASWPYFEQYEDILINNQEYGFESIYDLAIILWSFLGGEQFTGEPWTTEFGYVLDRFCPFIFWTDNHTLCLLLFWIDISEVEDPSCGYGWTQGYIRKPGTIPTNTSGTIQVELCNQSESIGVLSCENINVETISENENQEQCTLTVWWSYCGDGNIDEWEQCDDGNIVNGDWCSTMCTVEQNTGNTWNNNDWGGNGWENGGWGSGIPSITKWYWLVIKTDEEIGICNKGEDKSKSNYDRVCEEDQHNSADKKSRLIDDKEKFDAEVQKVKKSMTCYLDEEVVRGHIFGLDLWLTTVQNPCIADLMEPLDRQRLSKIMSMFATNIFDKKAMQRNCNFIDTYDISSEMKKFTKLSCELKIMGQNRDGTPNNVFNPKGEVTTEMFWVTLSRLLRDERNNTPIDDPRPWSFMHLLWLQKAGIMKYINNPAQAQIKWYALIALMRAYLTLENK